MPLDAEINSTKNQLHYDYIADAWRHLLGENFHWGYFQEGNEKLEKATVELVKLLFKNIRVASTHHLLDVGCGIGEPARFLFQEYKCSITGISTSEEGIRRACSASEDITDSNKLTFIVRNALDNGFPDESFDTVFLLEMSHLIRDKIALLASSTRVVKIGGTIALCDLTLRRPLSAREIVDRLDEIKLLERCFGKARLEPLSYYKQAFSHCGLGEIETQDVTSEVIPTIRHWRSNAEKNRTILLKHIKEKDIDDFIYSCDILQKYFDEGIWGYGVITGTKHHATTVTGENNLSKALF